LLNEAINVVETCIQNVGFEMTVKIIDLWVVMPCSLVRAQCFICTYCHHLQGKEETKQETSKTQAANNKIWHESCWTQNREWLW
jgi:hypothetical protein